MLVQRAVIPFTAISLCFPYEVHCDSSSLPVYRKAEVSEHKSAATGYWVTFKGMLICFFAKICLIELLY